jgi:hypothetical protein
MANVVHTVMCFGTFIANWMKMERQFFWEGFSHGFFTYVSWADSTRRSRPRDECTWPVWYVLNTLGQHGVCWMHLDMTSVLSAGCPWSVLCVLMRLVSMERAE